MCDYLYKITLDFNWSYSGKVKAPIYVVSKNKNEAAILANKYLSKGAIVKKVICLGVQCSGVIFSGSEKSKN